MPDYYEVLGVSRDATKEDIKKAYKSLAKKHHPDMNKNDAASEKKFKEINEAAQVLLDDQKRSHYDRFGTAGNQAGGGGGAGGFGEGFSGFNAGGFDDLGGFNDIFDSLFGGGGGRSRSRAQRGSDLLYSLEITLEDAAFGATKTITVSRNDTCDTCEGKGYAHEHDAKTCSACHGTGQTTHAQRTPFGVFQTTTTCRSCGGQGRVIEKPCHSCHGSGKIKINKKLDVEIPAGIDNGQRLRVKGEGEAGSRDGMSGDLYVEITIAEHDLFERDGSDIIANVKISYAQAVLGDEITVPTLKGKAKLSVPAATQSGTLFKMKGKGIPNLQSFGSGDQYVKIEVDVPAKLSKKQKELLVEFDKSIGGTVTKTSKSFFDKVKDALD